jgi:hypothetical protein
VQSSPSSVSPASMPTHTIKVGEEDHKFTPEILHAAVGDVRISFPTPLVLY